VLGAAALALRAVPVELLDAVRRASREQSNDLV
jgi:hypothetical protein